MNYKFPTGELSHLHIGKKTTCFKNQTMLVQLTCIFINDHLEIKMQSIMVLNTSIYHPSNTFKTTLILKWPQARKLHHPTVYGNNSSVWIQLFKILFFRDVTIRFINICSCDPQLPFEEHAKK